MTQLLPGQLLYIFGASILDAALLSWLALLWYRRSVNRLMREAPTGHGRRVCRTAETPRFLSRAAAPPTEPGELILTEERPEALPHPAAEPRPGMVRLIVVYGAGAAAFAAVITGFKFWAASPPLRRRLAHRVVDESVASRSGARGVARARSSDRSAPRASLSARRRDRHLFVHRGRTASQRHAQHRAADEYLLGRRQPRVDGIDPVRGHRLDRLAARARSDAARPGRNVAFRLRLDAVPRVVRSRAERRGVQVRVSQRRRVLVTRDAAVCPVHAGESSSRLARVAAPERAGCRIREQAIQRHPAGRRLLVGGCRCRSDSDVVVNRRMGSLESPAASPPFWRIDLPWLLCFAATVRRNGPHVSCCFGCSVIRRAPSRCSIVWRRHGGSRVPSSSSRASILRCAPPTPGCARVARWPVGRGIREDIARSGRTRGTAGSSARSGRPFPD